MIIRHQNNDRDMNYIVNEVMQLLRSMHVFRLWPSKDKCDAKQINYCLVG